MGGRIATKNVRNIHLIAFFVTVHDHAVFLGQRIPALKKGSPGLHLQKS